MTQDEMIDAWGAGYEGAWQGPGRVPSIGFNESPYQSDRLEIVQNAGRYPAPFHKGFGLGSTKTTSGADAAAIMLDLITGSKAWNHSHAMHDEVGTTCAEFGMAIDNWHVCDIVVDEGEWRTTIYLGIDALNDAGGRETHDLLIGWRYGHDGMHKLHKLGRAQKARRETAGKPLGVDLILLAALRRLPPPELARLAEHLRRNPTVPAEERGLAYQANWDRASLARHGCRLPDGVETVIVKKGVVSGRVRLGPRTTWCGGTLVHADGLPQTVTTALAGRRLADIVGHPGIDQRLVVHTAGIDRRNALRIRTRPMLETMDAASRP